MYYKSIGDYFEDHEIYDVHDAKQIRFHWELVLIVKSRLKGQLKKRLSNLNVENFRDTLADIAEHFPHAVMFLDSGPCHAESKFGWVDIQVIQPKQGTQIPQSGTTFVILSDDNGNWICPSDNDQIQEVSLGDNLMVNGIESPFPPPPYNKVINFKTHRKLKI